MKKTIIACVLGLALAGVAIAATSFVRETGVDRYLNPSAAISSGDVVDLSNRYGIALTDIASNETGAVMVQGVFDLPFTGDATNTHGAALYWVTTNAPVGYCSTASGEGSYIGLAVSIAQGTTNAAVKVQVDLNANDAK